MHRKSSPSCMQIAIILGHYSYDMQLYLSCDYETTTSILLVTQKGGKAWHVHTGIWMLKMHFPSQESPKPQEINLKQNRKLSFFLQSTAILRKKGKTNFISCVCDTAYWLPYFGLVTQLSLKDMQKEMGSFKVFWLTWDRTLFCFLSLDWIASS